MAAAELGTVLTVLRDIRGWTQEELAKVSGIRGSSISDYERGKMVPGLNTLRKLLTAEGYPLAAVEQVSVLVERLRWEGRITETGAVPSAPPVVSRLAGDPAALQWEIEDISADAGNVVARVVRVLLTALHHSAVVTVESEVPS